MPSQCSMASTVVAPRGKLMRGADGLAWRLRLFDGTIHQVDLKDFSANAIGFDTYDLTLNMEQMLRPEKSTSKRRREMNLAELGQSIRGREDRRDGKYFNALMRYHKMFSIPFATFTQILLGSIVFLSLLIVSAKWTGSRIIGDWLVIARKIACLIHQTAYEMNLNPRVSSNLLAARINPRFPSLTRSGKESP